MARIRPDCDAEREYIAAKAAYDKALARLIAAKAARPKPTVREGTLKHLAEARAAIWDAYLSGERDYGVLAERFDRSRGNISNIISSEKRERGFGPITPEEHRYRTLLDAAYQQLHGEPYVSS